MKTVKYLVVFILLAVIFGCSEQRAEKAVMERVDSMVVALETKGYRYFFENYMDPAIVLMAKSDPNYESGINSMDKEIDPSTRAKGIAQMKACKYIKPTFSNDYTKAVFKHKDFGDALTFIKVNGNWYIEKD